jgi:hypothetical protein
LRPCPGMAAVSITRNPNIEAAVAEALGHVPLR